MSQDAKNLILKLIAPAKTRLSAKEALEDKWVKKWGGRNPKLSKIDGLDSFKSMGSNHFHSCSNTFHKAAMTAIACQTGP